MGVVLFVSKNGEFLSLEFRVPTQNHLSNAFVEFRMGGQMHMQRHEEKEKFVN
jgi:hypothetical protein